MTTPALKELSTEDAQLYFQNTFLNFKDKLSGKSEWGYVHSIHSPVLWHVKFAAAGIKKINPSSPKIEIENTFPDTGAYNFEKTVLILQRMPKRQNRKGICTETISVTEVSSSAYKAGFLSTGVWAKHRWPGFTGANLNKLLSEHEYPAFKKAFGELKGMKRFAIALDKNFYLTQGLQTQNPSLWYRESWIGSIIKPNRIQVTNPLFSQEIVDKFGGLGMEIAL